MAIYRFCPKCKRDVPLADVCPVCGRELKPATLRVSWILNRKPVTDWFAWNRILRVLLPVYFTVAVAIILPEIIARGLFAFTFLMNNGLLPLIIALLPFSILVCFLVLFLQGEEEEFVLLDTSSAQQRCFLTDPKPIQLWLRGISTQSAPQSDDADGHIHVLISDKKIMWNEVSRFGTWRERGKLLLYKPSYYLYMVLHCSPENFDETQTLLQARKTKRTKK